MKFAVSILASRYVWTGTTRTTHNNHAVFLVEAANEFEAAGKGMSIARKGYPTADGWMDHHVVVCEESRVLDPSMDIKVTEVL